MFHMMNRPSLYKCFGPTQHLLNQETMKTTINIQQRLKLTKKPKQNPTEPTRRQSGRIGQPSESDNTGLMRGGGVQGGTRQGISSRNNNGQQPIEMIIVWYNIMARRCLTVGTFNIDVHGQFQVDALEQCVFHLHVDGGALALSARKTLGCWGGGRSGQQRPSTEKTYATRACGAVTDTGLHVTSSGHRRRWRVIGWKRKTRRRRSVNKIDGITDFRRRMAWTR